MNGTKSGSTMGGPDLIDCVKCFGTLRDEYISDIEMRVVFGRTTDEQPCCIVQVVSERFDDEDGSTYDHIWASKKFGHNAYLLSWGQLYDLLIVAHRQIERVLSGN